MKYILKGIIISVILSGLIFSAGSVNSLEMITNDKNIEIYKIKENVIINNNLVNFYETDPNKEDLIKYKEEQERIRLEKLEQEKQEKMNYKRNIAKFAMKFIGNPYTSGGTSLTNGSDCSGFVQSVYANFGVKLPRTSSEQSIVGTGISIEEIEVGDIVSYGNNGYVTHSALYIGDGMIVHASTPELGIRIDNMYIMPIITIRRVV